MITIIIVLYLTWIVLTIIQAYKWYNKPYYAQFKHKVRWGILFRLESFWIGIHHSKYAQRTCINFLPCLTLWIGRRPTNI